jgi:hypothetical protein
MRMGFTWTLIQNDSNLKLSSIPRMFNREYQKLLGNLHDQEALKKILHDKMGYSYSEVSYVLANLNSNALIQLTQPAVEVTK